MSNIDKKRSESELIENFHSEIHNFNSETDGIFKVGSFLTYGSSGYCSYIYKIDGISEDEHGVYFILNPLDGGSDKILRPSSFQYYRKLSDDFDINQYNDDVKKLLNGEANINDIGERLESSKKSNSTELMSLNKNTLEVKKNHLLEVSRYLTSVSERAKAELKYRMDDLSTMLSGFKRTINKITKLIFTINLYEGLDEEIHHIKIGSHASNLEPLTLRQGKLYMAEEVGDPTDKGLDFTNIEDFDNWLLQKNTYWDCYNYEFIVPEQKCVVALGIRRDAKQYVENPFINSLMNDNNKMCYLLIRNGDNIYRIYSDLRIGETLFPEQSEMLKLQEEYENSKWDSDKDKIDEKIDRYKFNMILLQGIIERTDCFPDEKYTLSLFKINDKSNIRFLYDSDSGRVLPSGIKPFMHWVSEKNIGTEVGSQILWFGDSIDWRKEKERMFKEYHYHDERYPNNPKTGLYQLEETQYQRIYRDIAEDVLFFKYDPKRDWWGYDEDKPRVKRVSFLFDIKNDIYINYDNITREDLPTLEFYLHTRINRRAYLKNIPILLEILKQKTEEFKKEDDFIKLSLTESGLNPILDFNKGVDALQWWKTKNKWKRTLSTDDVKALRMIIKKLTK